jgi:hypothetical protein
VGGNVFLFDQPCQAVRPSGSLDYAVSLDGPPQSSWRSHVELGP